LLLLLAGGSAAANPPPFVEASRIIPAGLEWNKEIVARVSGSISCEVTSKAAIAVTLIADRSYQAARSGNSRGMVRDDLIFTSDHADGRFSGDIQLPAAGAYWFIVENQSASKQRISLVCRKSDTAGE
jgi:hypothetical protein